MVEKCLKNIPATGLYFALYRLWSPQLALINQLSTDFANTKFY